MALSLPPISSFSSAVILKHVSSRLTLATGLLLFGSLVRIVGFFQNSSLNGDEAMLALSIGTRSFSELLEPLDYGQVAPVPFLWAERLVTLLAGVSGYTLRLLPLIAGVGLLWVVYRLADSLLGRVPALVALALAATAYPLIRYSVEVKPYVVDGLVAVLLVWLSTRLADDLDNRQRWAWLAVAGSAGVLLSGPALLVCAGIAGGLGIAAVRSKRWSLLPRLALVLLLWGGIFSAAYARWYATNAGAPYMREFWAQNFLEPRSPDFETRLWSALGELSCTLTCWRGVVDLWPLLLLAMIIGLISIWRRRGPHYAVLLAGPILAAFGASMLERYPLATRLLLFSAPLVAILAAAGCVAVANRIEQRWPGVRARWVLLLLVYPSFVLAVALMVSPTADWGFHGTEVKPLAELYQRRSGGEPVYIFTRAVPAWVFHTTDWSAPDTVRLAWVARIAGPNAPGFINAASRGRRRVGEGADLVYSSAVGTELYGTSTGAQVRRGHLSSLRPDEGWAESEAWRIRTAARPTIWIVMADYAHGPLDERAILMKAISQAGGRVLFSKSSADAVLVRLGFPGSSNN